MQFTLIDPLIFCAYWRNLYQVESIAVQDSLKVIEHFECVHAMIGSSVKVPASSMFKRPNTETNFSLNIFIALSGRSIGPIDSYQHLSS
jgi:hypothetical protein